jgi:hypothetical protein
MYWKLRAFCGWGLVFSLFITATLNGAMFMVTAMGLYEGAYWEISTGEIRGDTVDYRVELRQLVAKKCARHGTYELQIISKVIQLTPKNGSGATIVAHDFIGNGSWKLASFQAASENPRSKFPAIDGVIEARKLIEQAVKILPISPPV